MNNKKFLAYEKVRQSGLTNMFDITKVITLSDNLLTREDCLDIMKNYGKYKEISEGISEKVENGTPFIPEEDKEEISYISKTPWEDDNEDLRCAKDD